jgi:hypothetical protein
MGAHLALLAALFEDGAGPVAARGGLAGYLTVLENAFTYVPVEDILLGVLKAGDVADIAAALAPRPLLMVGLVNGRNIRVGETTSLRILEPAHEAYRAAGASGHLTVRAEEQVISSWLAGAITAPVPSASAVPSRRQDSSPSSRAPQGRTAFH